MAGPVVQIPGVGNVQFPDSMSSDQISAASAKLYNDGQNQAVQQKANSQDWFHGADTSPEEIDRLKAANSPMKQLWEGGKGFLKSAGQTIKSVVDLPDTIAGAVTGQPRQPDQIDKALTLNNENEKGGAMAENVAEFMLGNEALKGLSLSQRAGLLAKVAKVAESHPVVAKIIEAGMSSLRQGTLGTAQGLAHGEDVPTALEQGATVGALGGAIEGGPGVLKEAKTVMSKEAAQPALTGSIRETASEVASDARGAKTNLKGGSIRDTYGHASDAVMEKSKDLFKQIDDVTNGSFQPNQNALRQVQIDMRNADSDEMLDELKVKRSQLEAEQEEIFAEARKNGVDEKTVEQARKTYRQSSALEDVNNQLRMSTEGRKFTTGGQPLQGKETVDPKQFNRRLNKLYDSGRLQEAVGEQNATKLLKDTEVAVKHVNSAATYQKWAEYIAKAAGLGLVGKYAIGKFSE